MKFFLSFICLPFYFYAAAQDLPEKDKKEILVVLRDQQDAWNKGDLEGFMAGYWRSDSLKFIGKKGLTYGWKNTLENYKKSYPDVSAMGKLSFEIISVELIENDAALVIGKWQLEREPDNPSGYFTLVWKKTGGKWLIVADHSS